MFGKRLVISLLVLGLSWGMVGPVQAAEIRTGDKDVQVGTDEVINEDFFAGGDSVKIEGTVNGDVFVGAGTIRVTGTINGDLWAGGGMVEISGTVRDDVHVGSGNVVVRGAQIGDDLIVGAGNVSLDDETKVGGSIVFGVGTLMSEAEVGKSVVGGGGSVTVDGVVTGDITVGAGQLSLDADARVGGDVTYSSEKELSRDNAASVSGEIKQHFPGAGEKMRAARDDWRGAGRGFAWGYKVWSWLAALVTGLILFWLAPPFRDTAEIARTRPWLSMGVGLGVSILIFPLLLVMAMTVVGLPLAIIAGMVFLIETYLAKIVIGLALGSWLGTRMGWDKNQIYTKYAVGLLIYYLLTAVPMVGWVASLVGFLWGLGAIKIWKWELINSWRRIKSSKN